MRWKVMIIVLNLEIPVKYENKSGKGQTKNVSNVLTTKNTQIQTFQRIFS